MAAVRVVYHVLRLLAEIFLPFQNPFCKTKLPQGEKKGSVSAMLGSKGGVKRIAVVGLGKKDKKEKEISTAALEAIGAQVCVGTRRRSSFRLEGKE